jgi:serine phosphatase RsbU (regulator of sigma subunit)
MTEARRADDTEFGEEQLAALAAATAGGSAEGLADALTAAVITWTGGTVQDDATLIIVEREA